MSRPNSKGVMTGSAEEAAEPIEWEMRPGGMLVQKRDPDAAVATGPLIKIKVSHGLFGHDVSVPAHATFGDVKRLLIGDTGLQPSEMRLLFRGKEKEDGEPLHVAGVKDKAKLILVEDPAAREKKIQEQRKLDRIAQTCQAIGIIRGEVDKWATQVTNFQAATKSGNKPADQEMLGVSEMLMRQLLKLDGIEADGDAKALRRTEVKRIQNLVETIDGLRGLRMEPEPPSSEPNVVVTTNWETFDNGLGSLSAPPPAAAPHNTTDWETFD
ncbi:hypothetical protein KC19_4G032000 [Ceratodon purpureus]|uniref:BAG family molecular chaperone regulator 1 n=1 Tax=Ceratodon purpureus TaxID=3225 RepID=A0A8T0I7S9_CERPU|nr:hypothetical protein KC19_4G032000 [Ceratodon purpureus]